MRVILTQTGCCGTSHTTTTDNNLLLLWWWRWMVLLRMRVMAHGEWGIAIREIGGRLPFILLIPIDGHGRVLLRAHAAVILSRRRRARRRRQALEVLSCALQYVRKRFVIHHTQASSPALSPLLSVDDCIIRKSLHTVPLCQKIKVLSHTHTPHTAKLLNRVPPIRKAQNNSKKHAG